MGDYADINKDVARRLTNTGSDRLKTSYENYEEDKELVKELFNSRDGEELTAGADKSVFEERINEAVGDRAGISDDIDFMFNVLDTNGDGILSQDELDVVASYMYDGAKVDAHSIANYFYSLDQDAIKTEIKVGKDIEKVKNGTLSIEDIEFKYADDPETLEYIKKQSKSSSDDETAQSTSISDAQIEKFLSAHKDINAGTEESAIKAILADIYETDGLSDAELDAMAKKIKAKVGTRYDDGDGKYHDNISNEKGKITKSTYFNENGQKDHEYEYTYEDDGVTKKTETNSWYKDGKLDHSYKKEYNADGSYKYTTTRYADDGSIKSIEIKNYDAAGNEITE